MIVDKLHALLLYYNRTRGVGHTHVLIDGTRDNDCLIIAHTAAYAREIAMRRSSGTRQHVGFEGADFPDMLLGLAIPLAIDNTAMVAILDGALRTIAALQQEIDWLRTTVEPVKPMPTIAPMSIPSIPRIFSDVSEVCSIMQDGSL